SRQLVNDGAGTIDVTGGTLILATTSGITNAGVLEATGSGTLDVKDSTITNSGTATKGIVLDGTSTLLVHTHILTLTGSGKVALASGSKIKGANSSDTLDNVNNTIVGAGTISQLILQNDASGVIDATGILVLTT